MKPSIEQVKQDIFKLQQLAKILQRLYINSGISTGDYLADRKALDRTVSLAEQVIDGTIFASEDEINVLLNKEIENQGYGTAEFLHINTKILAKALTNRIKKEE